MAKFECRISGDFNVVLNTIEKEILGGSISASFEDGSNYSMNGVRCATRVYERYSFMGGNRVSLNITLMGSENELFLSAITSGGSQAVFFKLNTFGEEAFLNRIKEVARGFNCRI